MHELGEGNESPDRMFSGRLDKVNGMDMSANEDSSSARFTSVLSHFGLFALVDVFDIFFGNKELSNRMRQILSTSIFLNRYNRCEWRSAEMYLGVLVTSTIMTSQKCKSEDGLPDWLSFWSIIAVACFSVNDLSVSSVVDKRWEIWCTFRCG